MGATWRACAAFGAALLIAGCSQSPAASPTGTSLPAATPSSEAAPSPTAVVFASKRYHYSITLPIGWVATPSSVTWDGQGAPTIEVPMVDRFEPAAGEGSVTSFGPTGAFGLAAPTKSKLKAWVANGIRTTLRVHADTCPQKPDSVEPVTIGGQPGTLVAYNCGILINTAFTVANGYGYLFVFRDPTVQAATDPADHATFTTMLRSVVFH
jgi:hypothetical protein